MILLKDLTDIPIVKVQSSIEINRKTCTNFLSKQKSIPEILVLSTKVVHNDVEWHSFTRQHRIACKHGVF